MQRNLLCISCSDGAIDLGYGRPIYDSPVRPGIHVVLLARDGRINSSSVPPDLAVTITASNVVILGNLQSIASTPD